MATLDRLWSVIYTDDVLLSAGLGLLESEVDLITIHVLLGMGTLVRVCWKLSSLRSLLTLGPTFKPSTPLSSRSVQSSRSSLNSSLDYVVSYRSRTLRFLVSQSAISPSRDLLTSLRDLLTLGLDG